MRRTNKQIYRHKYYLEHQSRMRQQIVDAYNRRKKDKLIDRIIDAEECIRTEFNKAGKEVTGYISGKDKEILKPLLKSNIDMAISKTMDICKDKSKDIVFQCLQEIADLGFDIAQDINCSMESTGHACIQIKLIITKDRTR
jgi:hypothetical protein